MVDVESSHKQDCIKHAPLTRDKLLPLDIQISHTWLHVFSHSLAMFTGINLSISQVVSATMTFAFKPIPTPLATKLKNYGVCDWGKL